MAGEGEPGTDGVSGIVDRDHRRPGSAGEVNVGVAGQQVLEPVCDEQRRVHQLFEPEYEDPIAREPAGSLRGDLVGGDPEGGPVVAVEPVSAALADALPTGKRQTSRWSTTSGRIGGHVVFADELLADPHGVGGEYEVPLGQRDDIDINPERGR